MGIFTLKWTPPQGEQYSVLLDMLNQPHLLIAGSTGSGKSVLINSLIYTLLYRTPAHVNFILLDPKKVELSVYKELPHTVRYSCTPPRMYEALLQAEAIMNGRYEEMAQQGLRMYNGGDIYVFIDEFADLMLYKEYDFSERIIRIAQLGRAAKIHLIIATQRPTRDVITGRIKVNLDARVALRCPTAQDSRNIINIAGAEDLPVYGCAYYLRPPNNAQLQYIPYTSDECIYEMVEYWEQQKTPVYNFVRGLLYKPE